MDGQPSGLAATQVLSQTPAAANLLAGTSSNPLDDLVSIFGGSGGSSGTPQTNAFGGLGGGFGYGTPTTAASKSPPPQQQQQQEDLLGLF